MAAPMAAPVTAPAVDIDVLVQTEAWTTAVPAAVEICRRAAAAALRLGDPALPAGEASICLADDAFVRVLNHRYRGQDRPTNVLSFAGMTGAERAAAGRDGRPVTFGDIVVAYETTAAEAEDEAKGVAEHLSHLVVHGMLHLLGYDHETRAEAEAMERLETETLASLGVADPYAAAGDSGD
jgi:probable rRNA maturation factor